MCVLCVCVCVLCVCVVCVCVSLCVMCVCMCVYVFAHAPGEGGVLYHVCKHHFINSKHKKCVIWHWN